MKLKVWWWIITKMSGYGLHYSDVLRILINWKYIEKKEGKYIEVKKIDKDKLTYKIINHINRNPCLQGVVTDILDSDGNCIEISSPRFIFYYSSKNKFKKGDKVKFQRGESFLDAYTAKKVSKINT
jgi:hypothetical protein